MAENQDAKPPVWVVKAYIRAVTRRINMMTRRLRLNIIYLLLDAENPMSVTDIYIKLRAEQPEVSQALGELRRLGMVSAEREGKNIMYSVNAERYKRYMDLLNEFRDFYTEDDLEYE